MDVHSGMTGRTRQMRFSKLILGSNYRTPTKISEKLYG